MLPNRIFMHLLVVVIAVFAVFGRTLANGFVWDDIILLVNNQVYSTFNLQNMLFSLGNGMEYLPVRDISFAFDWLIWGKNPFGFHLTNLLLYSLNTVAVYILVRKLLRTYRHTEMIKGGDNDFAAFIAALLFALHPLHVEAVAFITCRNVLLSGLFTFVSMIFFLMFVEGTERRGFFLLFSFLFFVFAVFSKATAIVLPLLLLVCLMPLDRERWRIIFWTVPFFIGAFASFLIFRNVALMTNVIRKTAISSPTETAAVAIQIPLFYLKKIFFPLGLSAEYAEIFSRQIAAPEVIVSASIMTALSVLALLKRHKYPYLLTGLLIFVVALLPVMHFFPTYPVVADRYAYLPSFGICLATALLLGHPGYGGMRQYVLPAGLALVLFWSALSFFRVPVWQTEESLWKDVIRNYPSHVKGYTSLGAYYFQKREYDKAFPLFKRAQELDSSSPMYDYFQGYLLYQAGDRTAAAAYFDRALTRNSQFIMALYDKGLICEETGDHLQAAVWFNRMLASTDQDPLGFYKNAARQHLHKLSAGSNRKPAP